MSGLPPGDPQLVAMIVNHLKTQGLFDQFRRDCLADVDTKPAYLHLRQRVDNFVSNHLSNHTWSPQLNKNQLRNNIRQLVLQSGMLEQGVDRIVAQVVDPKIHHTFRPQVERIVRQFLSPGSHMEEEEPPLAPSLLVESQDAQLLSPALSSASAPGAGAEPPDSASSHNQEEAVGKSRSAEPSQEGLAAVGEEGETDITLVQEDHGEEEGREEEQGKEERRGEEPGKEEGQEEEAGDGDAGKPASEGQAASEREVQEGEMEVQREAEAVEVKKEEQDEEQAEEEEKDEAKERSSRAVGRSREESREAEQQKCAGEKQHIRQRARERLKEEYSLEDSDLEGLSDITVSSVHTSDLSSFESESEGEQAPSDSTEEGEITSEDESVQRKSAGEDVDENKEKKPRGARQGYVHKPFLYSRYYSDSDDEVTVEQRRRSAAKEKEERVLKRQQNRERLEEKRRQKAAQPELQEKEKLVTAASNQEAPRPQAKEARKEKKVLEKKVALSRKRKRDSRKEDDSGSKRKSDVDADPVKKEEALKHKAALPKPLKKPSEAEEQRRRKSGSVSEDSCEPRRPLDKTRTHSFILDLEMGSEDTLRQRGGGRSERHARGDGPPWERERAVSDERSKHRPKPDGRKTADAASEDRGVAEDKGEKKGSKVKGERRSSAAGREGRPSVSEGSAAEEGALKASKKGKSASETPREKEKKTGKGEPKSLPRLDSAGSAEERLEVEVASEGNKKKDKHPKDVLKKSKSHTEVRTSEKVKGRQDSSRDSCPGEREKNRPEPSTSEPARQGSDADRDAKKETGSKVKSLSEKPRSKSRDDIKPQSPPGNKTDRKPASHELKVRAGSRAEPWRERKKDERTAEKAKEARAARKTSDKRTKEAEKKAGESEKENKSSPAPPAAAAQQVQPAAETPPQPSDTQSQSDLASLDESDLASPLPESNLTEPQADSLPASDLIAPQKLDGESDLTDAQASDVLTEPEVIENSPRQPADSCLRSDLVAIAAPDSMAVSDHTVADSSNTAVPDDMYDALSDITPEPEDEEEAAMRLADSQEPPHPLPVEADALLTLVDVCASAAGSDVRGMPARQEVECSFHEADMKMKEAALTLLSMDPDMSVPQSLITESQLLVDAQVAVEETPVTQQQAEPQPPDLDDVTGASEPPEAVKESESDTPPGALPEEERRASQDGDQHPNALMSTNTEGVVTEGASVEDVMSEGDGVQVDRLDPESQPQGEVPAADLSANDANDELARTSEDASANPVPSQTDTHPLSVDHEAAHTESAETQPEINAQEDQSKAFPTETHEPEGTREPSAAENPRVGERGDVEGWAVAEPEVVKEPQAQPARRGRPPKLIKQASSASKSDGREDESSDVSEVEDRVERRMTRRGRQANQKEASLKDSGPADQETKEPGNTAAQENEDEEADEGGLNKGRSSKAPDTPQGDACLTSQTQEVEAAGQEVEQKEQVQRGRRRSGAQPSSAAKPPLKRKRSDQAEDSGKELPAKEEDMVKRADDDSGVAEEVGQEKRSEELVEDREEEGESESFKDSKEETEEEEKDEPVRKTPRRGRPSKIASGADESSAPEKREGDMETGEDEEKPEEEETKTRATTRAASRLEAEKNKPSKPSTRAFSKLSGKEETSPSRRGSRGHVSGAVKGRKREVSPPTPRTRAGHKTEEPPAKRAKR